MSDVRLVYNEHGKGRVRVAKVRRNANGVHDIMEMTVQILLQGDNMEDAFTEGNNRNIVPTDTCKNTVYYLARTNNFDSIEEFALIIAKHFLNTYTKIVNQVSVHIIRQQWERVTGRDSSGRIAPHKHAFTRNSQGVPFVKVQAECRGNGPHNRTGRPGSNITIQMQGGFKGLDLLKTTQSGFIDFHKCPRTTLPSDTDRFIGTSADVEWKFDSRLLGRRQDYNKIFSTIKNTLLHTFTGPADTGIYSPSVQKTLYEMGEAAIRNQPAITQISLYMPNIHFLVFPTEKIGVQNKDRTGLPDTFYPIDEPHGMIKATVERTNRSRL